MGLCTRCGFPLQKGQRSCPDCGVEVNLKQKPAQSVPDQIAALDDSKEPPVLAPLSTSDESSSILNISAGILKPGPRHKVVLLAAIPALLAASAVAMFLLLKPSNHPPRLEAFEADRLNIRAGNSVVLTARANDPEGDQLHYNWVASAGQIVGEGSTVTLDTSQLIGGTDRIEVSVTVSDQRAGAASGNQFITVEPELISTPPGITDVQQSTQALPLMVKLEADKTTVSAGDIVKFTARVPDYNPAELDFEWKTSAGSIQPRVGTASLQLSGLQSGTATQRVLVTVTVRSSSGGVQSDTRTINVVESPPQNWPPTVTLRASRQSIQQGEDIEIVADAQDRDGDAITYSWNSSTGQLLTNGKRAVFRTSAVNPGQVEVRVTAADVKGETATDNLIITVLPRPNPSPTVGQGGKERSKITDSVNDRQGGYSSGHKTRIGVEEEFRRPGSLSMSSATDSEGNIIVSISGPPGRAVATSGSIDVTVGPVGKHVSGFLLSIPCRYSLGYQENVSAISIKDAPGVSNRYSLLTVRVRPKNSRQPVRFSINWMVR